MKKKLSRIFALLAIFALVSLACLATPKPDEVKEEEKPPAAEEKPATKEATVTKESPAEKPQEEAPADEEYIYDEGGFKFKPIPGWQVDCLTGIIQMKTADADPQLGPAFMIMAGDNEKEMTNEAAFDKFKSELEAGVTITDPEPVKVGGFPGLKTSLTGQQDGKDIQGIVVISMLTSKRQFSMMAAAPAERYDAEIAPYFDDVLKSILFISPKPGAGCPAAPGAEGTTPETYAGMPENEIYQWAISAKASSQYGDSNWAASQATGEPNVEACGDNSLAWAPKGTTTKEWIELEYATPVIPITIDIIQSYNPNQVVRVEVRTLGGKYREVWKDSGGKDDLCPMTLSIPVTDVVDPVNAVKINIDQSIVKNWNEIDAVALLGTKVEGSGGSKPPKGGSEGSISALDIPVINGGTEVSKDETTLNYWVEMERLAVRDYYVDMLGRLGWSLDKDDNGKCIDNDRCMGWHNDYSDPENPNWFFIQGEHAYLTMNLIAKGKRTNVVITIDPEFKK